VYAGVDARDKVSAGTANRAVAALKAEGLVVAGRGKRAVVAASAPSQTSVGVLIV
jgi:DNA-binding GntR family transcriptional regulator